MTVTPASFALHFPEFSDATAYPIPSVGYWLSVAQKMLDPCVWGEMLDTGIELYIAHNIVLEAQAAAASAKGATPGAVQGPLASKGAGGLSASYDIGAVTIDGAGAWNATTYGTRFYQLSRMFGAGGAQL